MVNRIVRQFDQAQIILFGSHAGPKDIIVSTLDEHKHKRDWGGSVLCSAQRAGVFLYENASDRFTDIFEFAPHGKSLEIIEITDFRCYSGVLWHTELSMSD